MTILTIFLLHLTDLEVPPPGVEINSPINSYGNKEATLSTNTMSIRGLRLWLSVSSGGTPLPLWDHSDWTIFRAVQTLQIGKASAQSAPRQERHKRLFDNTYVYVQYFFQKIHYSNYIFTLTYLNFYFI